MKNAEVFITFCPDGAICDSDKPLWVQGRVARGRRAAGRPHGTSALLLGLVWVYLVLPSGRLCSSQVRYLVRFLFRDNRSYSDEKSPASKVELSHHRGVLSGAKLTLESKSVFGTPDKKGCSHAPL
jgi:hypothetical protein